MAAVAYGNESADLPAILLTVAAVIRRRTKRQQRRSSMPYILRRHTFGAFNAIVMEMESEDPKQLKNFLRMSATARTFEELLQLVAPFIIKENTTFKGSIPPEERLAVTLRYLASGGTYLDMFYLFRIPASTLGYIIPDTCEAIYKALKARYLKFPDTEQEWLQIQADFMEKWQFPQCIGALDGKHVRIQNMKGGGSNYYNYLGYFSIVLFAMVDANYRFLYFEVGAPGRTGDATIWNNSRLKDSLENNSLQAPPPCSAPGSNVLIPSLIIADSAFALSSKVMKPYPERNAPRENKIFNYRLSRARRVVENAFGILAARFRIFQSPIMVHPLQARKLILSTLALHNMLRNMKDERYLGPGTVDSEYGPDHEVEPAPWRQNQNAHLPGLQHLHGGARDQSGTEVRNALRDYFMNLGAVPWQNQKV